MSSICLAAEGTQHCKLRTLRPNPAKKYTGPHLGHFMKEMNFSIHRKISGLTAWAQSPGGVVGHEQPRPESPPHHKMPWLKPLSPDLARLMSH
ncbi:hypothetical protein CDAR_221061 [Caerostris darwini]|uniref:Uncharacterized protein n=1 Tax=Caerostris darwini TaxID=1538125 RepID=A0AAV4TG12_9ARAC|nr:hypothetical protein CDAR_221061 [Caerostris darwini]